MTNSDPSTLSVYTFLPLINTGTTDGMSLRLTVALFISVYWYASVYEMSTITEQLLLLSQNIEIVLREI